MTLSLSRIVTTAARVGASLTVAVLAACGGDSAGPHRQVPSTVTIASGGGQTGAAGLLLGQPIVVRVTDAGGASVSGIAVSFAVSAGGGSVGAGSATSDAVGLATTQWTLGTKAGDAQQLTVTVPATASVTPLVISASAIAGTPAALDAPTSLAGQAGLALPPITVVLRDQFGNRSATSGRRVSPRLDASASQTLNGAVGVTTDTSGAVVSGLSIVGKAGGATLILDSDGLASARVSVILGGGTPVQTRVSGLGTIDADAGVAGPPVSATPVDAWDNPVAGVDVTFAIDGIGTIGHATSGQDGVATLATWTAPAFGSYRLTATAAGATSAQYQLTTHHPPPATLTPSPSNLGAGQAGSELVLDVLAKDAAGNPVPSALLRWTCGTLSGSGNTDNTGVAHLDVRLGTKAGATQVLVQSGTSVSTMMTVQITPARFAAAVALRDTVTAPAGTSVVLSFRATDFYGNPTPNETVYGVPGVTWATGSTMTPSVTSGPDGVAQFTVTLDPLAATLDFGVAVFPGPFGGLAAVTNVISTASRGSVRTLNFACTLPANQFWQVGLPVGVFGPDGRAARGVSVTWKVQPGNGTVFTDSNTEFQNLLTIASTSDSRGIATVNWLLPSGAANYKITATAPAPYDGGTPAAFFCLLN